jgi:ABC-2 type transport system permease protein
MQWHTISKKTIADCSHPKILAGYFALFLSVVSFLAWVIATNEFSADVATLAVAEQEIEFLSSALPVVFFWSTSLPVLLLGAVLGGNTLAKELDRGSLRIVLSKAVRRWEVVFGIFTGLVGYLFVVAVASTSLTILMFYRFSGVSPAALEGGFFETLPALLVFVLFVAVVISAFAVALAVHTRNRLQTALGAFSVPVLFFGMWITRLLSTQRYEEYNLYWLDVNYHLGNTFVYVYKSLVGELAVETQGALAIWSGVYQRPKESDQVPESLDLVGHVSQEVSMLGLAVVAVVSLAFAFYRFDQLDV